MLEVQNLTKYFGGFCAVSNLSFSVGEREWLGLVGPNGAGKTTVLNTITGFLTPTEGRFLFQGVDITRMRPWRRAQAGVVRTFQNTELFFGLTVWENIATGCQHLKGRQQVAERVDEILEFTGLKDERNKLAEELSYGNQRMLGIAIALAVKPKVLLLDEPLAGMNPAEAAACMDLVRQIVNLGTAIILVEHNMRAVMANCTRVIVIHHGQKLAEGTPKEIQQNPAVIEAYLGRSARSA